MSTSFGVLQALCFYRYRAQWRWFQQVIGLSSQFHPSESAAMAKEKFSRKKPHVNVGTIGH
ncbi:MAG: hypothetical protein COS34_08480, partial [Lysobacterales bacterium CG02_land_8_20_14_3_00_62_12]